MITSFHGIGAYRGQRNPLALRNALDTVLTGVEVCTADRPIGAFGVVIGGDCRAVFNTDVWSIIDEHGNRYHKCWYPSLESVVPDTQAEYLEFCQKHSTGRYYCEAWVRAYALRAVWIKNWADAATMRAAQIMARNRNVPLITVSGGTRIWDLLDSQRLPVIPAVYAKPQRSAA